MKTKKYQPVIILEKKNQTPELVPPGKGERFAELIAITASAAPWIGGPISGIIGMGIGFSLIQQIAKEFCFSLDRPRSTPRFDEIALWKEER